MPVPTSIFPFVRAWSSSRIQPQKIARCTESTLRKILAYLVPFMKQPLSILFPLAAKSLPMWMRKVEQSVVPRVVPAQKLGLGHRHQAAGIHGPTAVRLLQPKYSKPNTVQTGVGSARTGATPSYIRERLRRHPCSHWQETLPAVVASESAPDVTMGPVMAGCWWFVLAFTHPSPAVASSTPPRKHQETVNSSRSCQEPIISHTPQARYFLLKRATFYPTLGHRYDAARVKIYHLPLTAKCHSDFLIHYNGIFGKCWPKSVVLVAVGLTLFLRHEVRDLLARVHPSPRWEHRQYLPCFGPARFLYFHISLIPQNTCREAIYGLSDIGYHCSMEGSLGAQYHHSEPGCVREVRKEIVLVI